MGSSKATTSSRSRVARSRAIRRRTERHPPQVGQAARAGDPPDVFMRPGLNYRETTSSSRPTSGVRSRSFRPPKADVGFIARNNALCADGEAIVIPKDASEVVQYGRRSSSRSSARKCRNVSEAQALGLTCSATHDRQRRERRSAKWQRGRPHVCGRAKEHRHLSSRWAPGS